MKRKILSIITLILCAVISTFSLTGCDFGDFSGSESSQQEMNPIYNENGQIKVPDSSANLHDSNYKTAVKNFHQAGFRNIRVHYLNDTFFGLFVTVDGIDEISINGVSSFDENSYFDTKCVVLMTVHTTSSGSEIYAEEIDEQLPIMYGCSDLEDNDKFAVMSCYQEIGFTNFTFTPIQDCYGDWDWDLDEVETVSVNGTTNYSMFDFYDKDALINISYHTVEGDYCTNGLEHTPISVDEVEATCTQNGWTSGTKCSVCSKALSGCREIPALGHEIVVDTEAVIPTCISKGCTEGAHCSRCNEVLSISQELPIDSNNHVNITVIPGTLATCQSIGICNGTYCNDCNKTIIEQEELPIDPDNHTNVIVDEAVPATQTKTGLSEGKHCGDCGAVIVAQKTTTWVPTTDWLLVNHTSLENLQKYCSSNTGEFYITCRIYEWHLYSSYYSMKFYSGSTVGTIFYARAIDCKKVSNTSALRNGALVGIRVRITGCDPDTIYINVNSITIY